MLQWDKKGALKARAHSSKILTDEDTNSSERRESELRKLLKVFSTHKQPPREAASRVNCQGAHRPHL